jgi:hypothetical protein
VLLPRAARADGAETLLSQQMARGRYGPRVLRLREKLETRRADVRESFAPEAAAVHLFVSGAYRRGSDKAKRLQELETLLLRAAETNDTGAARAALDEMIDVASIKYKYSYGNDQSASAISLPAEPAPPSNSTAVARRSTSLRIDPSSALLALLSGAIFTLVISKNTLPSRINTDDLPALNATQDGAWAAKLTLEGEQQPLITPPADAPLGSDAAVAAEPVMQLAETVEPAASAPASAPPAPVEAPPPSLPPAPSDTPTLYQDVVLRSRAANEAADAKAAAAVAAAVREGADAHVKREDQGRQQAELRRMLAVLDLDH